MYLKRFALLLAVVVGTIFLLFFTMVAQQPTKAVLVDNIGPENCEVVMGRWDRFLAELQQHPDSTGLVVNYGRRGDAAGSVLYENFVKTYPTFRKFPLDRLEFVRGPLRAERKTDFWLIPAGADQPSVDRSEWSLSIDPSKKPFLVASDAESDIICPPIGSLKLLDDLLEANPRSRANIVLRGPQIYIRRKRKEISSSLTKHIAARRIRVFTQLRRSPSNLSAETEYWFLP